MERRRLSSRIYPMALNARRNVTGRPQQARHESDVTRRARVDRHPGGRPSKYREDLCSMVHLLASLGVSNDAIAKALNIGRKTLYRWIGAHGEFRHSMTSGRELADGKVTMSLFERAIGYTAAVEVIFVNSETGAVTRETTLKHYPPDTPACMFWLRNRASERWDR